MLLLILKSLLLKCTQAGSIVLLSTQNGDSDASALEHVQVTGALSVLAALQ